MPLNHPNPIDINREKVHKIESHNQDALSFKKSKLIIYLVNMIYFGIAILLFVVGITYLTAYSYDYSFTAFSTSFISGIFIAFSIVLIALATLNVISVQSGRQTILIISTFVMLIFFVALFCIAIWGLVASTRDNLNDEARDNMLSTVRRYDERDQNRFETLKFDWLQTRFNCCGINTYSDWRAFFLYGGEYKPINFVSNQWDINNKLPYIDNVPDSCCTIKMYNCGKQYRNQAPSNNMMPGYQNYNYNNNYNMNNHINMKGCLDSFLTQFLKDIVFLAGLAMGTSSLCLLLWFLLACVYLVNRLRK
jgi:hypothetical protein